jgi:hypothetical protein
MSKLDVGVGDEFPLDEDNSRPHHGHRHHGHRRFFRGHHHPHRHHHHFRALPLLLILGGVAALIVAGKISALTASAMIGLGLLLLAVMIFSGVRRFRRFHSRDQA